MRRAAWLALALVVGACGGGSHSARPPRPVHWLSLGDSFAAADGVPGSGRCSRSDQAFAPLTARALKAVLPIATFTHVACSGAQVGDIESQLIEGASALPSGTRYDLVTVIIGGNDVGFAQVLLDCYGAIDLRRGCSASADELRRRVDDLERHLEQVFRTVRDRLAPGGRVLVVGYPQLFDDPTTSLFGGCQGLRTDDIVTLRTVGNTLNDAVARAAGTLDRVEFVDVREIFGGHGLCGKDTKWVHGVNVGVLGRRTPVVWSFHPNATGQLEEAHVLERKLRELYAV